MKKIFTAVFWLIIQIVGLAQTTLTLDEVIVQGSRVDSLTPVTVVQYPIDRKTGEDPALFLSTTPGIYSYSDMGNFQGYSYLRMRGVDQTRINFTLDGIPLNESEDQGVYFSNYADIFGSVDHAQIQRGTAISYGSASYVGSVNFESPKLFGEQNVQANFSGGSFKTFRHSFRYDMGENNGWGFHFRGSGQTSDGYRDNMYNKGYSGFVSTGKVLKRGIVKLINFTGHQRNKLGWLGSYLSDIEQNRKHNQNSNEFDKFTQSLTGLSYLQDKLSATLYYNYLKGDYDFNINRFLYDDFAEENPLFNYALEHHMFGGFLHYRVEGKIPTTLTAHANLFKREHSGFLSGVNLYGNHGLKHEQSVSVESRYKILYGKVQYRHADFGYVGDVPMEDLNWNFVNYKVGVNWKKFYYSFGSTGREPSRTDLFGGEDNLVELISIQPERNFDHELGFKLKNLMINAYYMKFKNEITLNGEFGPNSLPIKSNVATSQRYGLELDYRDSLFTLAANLSDNIIDQEQSRFHHILSPSFLMFGAVHRVIEGIGLEVNSNYQSRQYLDFSNDNFIDGFATFGAKVTFPIKQFSVDFHIRNIFNQKGFSYGHLNVYGDPVYISNAGTNFLISLKYN